ncbi:MAG: alanyl-tRNA editing protein [Mogibacterium sp.]|nr:alanyl-tRNA editing protein [Mogibacterium sp.]
MSTIRIYRDNQYAASCETIVTSVREKDGFDQIACAESVFYPEGGGQPSDMGTVSRGDMIFEISHASDESIESDVWHLTDAPSGTFEAGDKIILAIDYDYRFRNMQRHLGEHMLSGAIYTLFGGVNKGFHIGDGYVSIDIDLEGRMLTDEELDLAEHCVNEAIWANLPVTTEWFYTYEESLSRPVRKRVPHDGRISVVSVGDLEDPFDCIACCGVHPANSAEVGLVSIYKCESNKGMNRIFFDCGACAIDKLSADSHILRDIAAGYSCSSSDVPSRMAAEAEKVSALKSKLADMTGYVKEAEKANIIKEVKSASASVYSYSSAILSPDELLKLGFDVVHEVPDLLLFMISKETNTCIILSSREDINCGALVKDNAGEFGGKGGGRADNARAMFDSAEDMEAFISHIIEAVDIFV